MVQTSACQEGLGKCGVECSSHCSCITLLYMDCFVYIAVAAALLFASKPSIQAVYFFSGFRNKPGPQPTVQHTMSTKPHLLYSMFGLAGTGGLSEGQVTLFSHAAAIGAATCVSCQTFLAPWQTFLAPWQTFLAPQQTFQAPWKTSLGPWQTFQAPWQTFLAPLETFLDLGRPSWHHGRPSWHHSGPSWHHVRPSRHHGRPSGVQEKVPVRKSTKWSMVLLTKEKVPYWYFFLLVLFPINSRKKYHMTFIVKVIVCHFYTPSFLQVHQKS